jgi:hypothetical protein
MPSSFSPNLRIELIAPGEQAGTWGTTTNTNLGTLIEDAITGYATVSVASANQAFTAANGAPDQARNAIIELTTSTGADFAVYAPPESKQYTIKNSSAHVATIYNSTVLGNTTAAGTGVAIPAGRTVTVLSNGTNFSVQNDLLIGNVVGDVVGNVTGNLTGNVTGNVTGNADTATKLVTSAFSIEQSDSKLAFIARTTFTAAISSTVMTVTAATVGQVNRNSVLTGTGVTGGTTIVAQLTSTETAAATVSYVSGGAAGESIFEVSSASGIAAGQMISGTGIPVGTYVAVGYDGSTIVPLANQAGVPVAFTTQAVGAYTFAAAAGAGTYTVSASQTVASTTITATNTIAALSLAGVLTITNSVVSHGNP